MDEKERTRKSITLWVIVLIGLVVIAFALSNKGGAKSSPPATVSQKKCVEILDKEGVHEYEYITITGTVKNVCDHTISYIKLMGVSYNDELTQVGSDWSYVDSNYLPANAESEFTIMYKVPDDSSKFKVIVVEWND